ncbi:MAG: prepilin-type N-terminal cleavage/methylation domain-containing protein [Candidatus Falkowbacteria bacterium]|nr:prepilin-type N-terminal cleavage/methylation domain-containing protein [Candidatus Falkowbacteria bacterium]
MTPQNKKLKFGFTLIELLVVIAIIGVLSTMAIIALGNARAKARDSKRVADIKQISTALELYYADYGYYPTIITPGNALASADGTKTYMGKIPTNPTPRNDGSCGAGDYSYSVNGNNSLFSISTCLGSGSNNINTGVASYSPNGLFSCGQKISDVEGNQYDTVQIGTQCWTKQNINTGTTQLCAGAPGIYCVTNPSDDTKIEKYCYNNNLSSCNTGGTFYQWSEAMNLPISCATVDCSAQVTSPHKGICPDAWHIPTDNELKVLDMYLGLSAAEANAYEFRGSHNEDLRLKVGGDTGFNGVLVGFRYPDGSFVYLNTYLTFWGATQGPASAYYRGVYDGYSGIYRNAHDKAYGRSVRCLKD